MATLPPEPPKVTRTGRDERSLEDMVERDLLTAEDLQSDGVDELEHELWTDPCHFLRRACQDVDYGPPGAFPRASREPACARVAR